MKGRDTLMEVVFGKLDDDLEFHLVGTGEYADRYMPGFLGSSPSSSNASLGT